MEINEFVKKVLLDLVNAVDDASAASSRKIKLSEGKDTRTVEFDIAVSVEKANTAEGKAGIQVLHFVEGGGTLSRETKNSTVSRVKFGVNVDSWTKQEHDDYSAELANRRPTSYL